MAKGDEQSALPSHGASVLPSVQVESYNVEVEDDDGFIGDKASKGAFWEIFDKWREPLRKINEDPLSVEFDQVGLVVERWTLGKRWEIT